MDQARIEGMTICKQMDESKRRGFFFPSSRHPRSCCQIERKNFLTKWKTIDGHKNCFFSTSLPLVSTWWVWSTFTSQCPLSSNQLYWLTIVTLIIFPLKFFWQCWESNLWLLGENQICYLCAKLLPGNEMFSFQTLFPDRGGDCGLGRWRWWLRNDLHQQLGSETGLTGLSVSNIHLKVTFWHIPTE